jgi:prepilin-type N-terminal cleavage/methylation domain-containing protein
MKRVRAFTLVELLVVIAIIALLVSLLLPALAKAQKNARSLKDKAQIRQIHMAYLGFANDNPKGKLPTPGLINRLAFDVSGTGGGVQVSGAGPEDYSLNHSALGISLLRVDRPESLRHRVADRPHRGQPGGRRGS